MRFKQFNALIFFSIFLQDLKERTDKEQQRELKVRLAYVFKDVKVQYHIGMIRVRKASNSVQNSGSSFNIYFFYLIVDTLLWHQRIKVVSDLLVQLATVERQESRSKLQQECNKLGNVGVMRCESLRSTT